MTKVRDYTVALQTQLQLAGYYKGKVDGIYGPETVDAVKKLQTDSDLPATGFVDRATALALDAKVQAIGANAATQSLTQTAAVQSVLKVAGYWTGPIDGKWTPELTDALKEFQTALGRPPQRRGRRRDAERTRTNDRESQDPDDHNHKPLRRPVPRKADDHGRDRPRADAVSGSSAGVSDVRSHRPWDEDRQRLVAAGRR